MMWMNSWRFLLFSTSNSSDYRVSSIHDSKPPGKLSDFIPEVERAAAEAQGDDAACDIRRRGM